ncbi:MAG: leucine-rich repeat protein, partial [Clostridia bacterium]|nr:leucine-rich repeat protein [Clostridia bacterium]
RVFRYDNDLNSWILSGEHGDDGDYEISTSAVSLIVKGNKFYYSNENPATLLGLIENNWDENKIFELVETEDGWKQVANDVILTTNKEIAFAGHLFYVVTSNVVIYSNHVTSVYDINYVTNSDDVIATKQYAHGTYSVAPSENLTKEDYVFIGWYTEPEFKNKYVFGLPVTSNLTLYARWEVKIAYTEGMIYALNDSGTAYALIGVEEGFDKNDVVVANFFGNPGLPVDSIGASAFAGNKVIKTIELPSTLANIGPSAFMNMEGLVSINIPASVSIIPDNAFNGAINLETVIFDNYSTLSTIGMNAFAKTQSLKYSVVDGVKKAFAFPASLTTIESGAFLNSTAITEITIPANVIKIEDKAFAGATGIRYAVFERTTPANLGENVFQNKNSFRVYVPSVSMYTSGAANANWKLIKDKIHEISSIVTIDGVAEWSYNLATDGRAVLIQYLGKELTEVVIPEFLSVNNQTIRVAEIGDYAFDGPIQSIAFDAVVGISANTFASTEQLSNLSITVGSNNSINSGYLFDAYSSVPNLNTLSITPNITIPELFGGTAPTALTVVKTLSGTMSPNFLENCVYVKEVVIGGLTANISAEAFLNCTALEKVVFDNREYSDVNAIGMNAFKGAISLETFEILTSGGTSYGIPEKVTTIGANAFEGTKWLKSNSNDMIIIGNGILYRYNGTDSIVAIPENVVSITASAFAGNEKLRQVYVVNPQSALLADIGANAFAGCVNLESVVLSAGVENVGASAFEGDNKLVSIIHFGDGEPSLVGDYAFNKTHPEMKIYLPATASKWTGYSSELVENLTLFEEIKTVDSVEEKWIWIYGKAKGNNGIMIIKALGMQGDNLALTVPEQLNGMDVYEIADYALPRVTTKLSYSTFIKNLGSKPFGGVTFLTEATIRNSYNTHNVTPEAMMSLFAQNEELSVLNSDATISIKNLIGGTLPQNVKTVNILVNATAIVANFLEDNEYVEYITVTTYDKVGDALTNPTITALEETLSIDKAYNIASVGAKAFRNTAWMKSYEGEYVIVLGGNLVDYKGVNSILEIPETVEFINGSIFENDETIEVVNIPATVKNIGDHAFSGANNLTKIFISATTAPTIYADTFDINVLTNNGMEIFVPASALADEQSGYKAGTWNGLNPVSDSGIVRVKNQTSSNSFEEYIINSNDKKLLLSRRYTVTYSNGLVTEIVENSTAIAPTIVNDRASGNSYSIQALGNNVFMSAVQNVVIDIMHQVNDYSFKNLGELDEVTISGLVNQERKLTSANIVKIFNDHDAKTIAFVGNVTLDTLVGEDSTIDSLVGVKITDGVIETVDELLKGWTSITSVEFPASIEKVGINSLEDTAWYKDYTSSVYGNDFVVLGGSLLYKYKGAGTGLVTIPNAVKIVNTGAFSKYESGAWSSTLPVKQIRFGTESNSNAHTILEHAFSGCKQLNSILLPESMSNIAPSAFDGTAFTITNGMLIVAEENGKNATLVKFTGDESNFVDGTLTIPSTVKKIAAGAFQNVTALKKITYPNDSVLTTICEDAFNGATSLLEVQLPSTVKFIGKNAFYNTLWFGKAIQKQVDVMIGGVLYQKVVPGASYTLYDNVTSIVEDALVPIMPFTIDGITYSTDENVRVTELIIEEGSFLKASELYSILSKGWVESIITNGQVTLSGLIGSDEPLDNIVRIGFLQRTTSIAAGYAENWTNVREITNVPASVTEIGENAFRGTKWFENQNKPGFNFAGESNVVIKYVGDETDLEIGSYVGETVTGITADAFRGNENLKSIVFGKYSKLSKIPAGAFRDCINLESIVFNDLITEFGEDAFANTPWLANYDNDFVIIDGVMIEYKGAGGEIVIPKGTTKIYPYVFRGNDTITSVRFDENCLMTAIEANTFRDCVNLEELIINEHILSVDRTAVQGTKWLAQTSQIKVNLGGSILYYENAYHGIKRIVLYVGTENSIIIPNTVTEIVPNAFKRVTSLAQITFSEGKLVAIPDGAFEGCTSLREVVFASAITNIGENAFAGTPWLAEQSAEFVIRNGILIKYNGTSTAVEIPENVTLIGESAFSGSQIVSIDMSNANIETILAGTFSGISTLENVVFSNATNYVGEGAFNDTKYLANAPAGLLIANGVALIAYIGNETDITIPNGVRYLNADVFQNNANLLSITFTGEIEIAPNAFVNNSQLADVYGTEHITYVGKGAFSGTKYQSINVSSGYIVVNGRLVDYVGTETQLVIPADVEYIPEGIFGGNENIVSVDFSKASSTLSIEANAFRNAVNLKDIVFGDNIDYIGSRAFYNTAWMESYSDALIISPAGKLLAYVRENASVTIPNTVKSFARDVFKGNKNITSVYFASGSNVNIPTEAFKDCTSLLNVTFNGTFQIGENAFQNTEWYKLEANKTSNRG